LSASCVRILHALVVQLEHLWLWRRFTWKS